MLQSEPELTPLMQRDVPAALRIINSHDEDDAEGAEDTYSESLENQFGLRLNGDLVGVTGFTVEAQGVAWLSWHYVDPAHQGKRYGEFMLRQVQKMLQKEAVRKLFISTSDYADGLSGPLLYQKAIDSYQRLGFQREGYHPNYFAPGEGEILFGKKLGTAPPPEAITEEPWIVLQDATLINETDSSYYLNWEWDDAGHTFSGAALKDLADYWLKNEATSVFIAFPSDVLPFVEEKLNSAGFKKEVTLKDYHAEGVDEIRLRRNRTPN